MNVLKGNDTHEVLIDPDFRESWQALLQTCPWATPFQSWEYVSTWYSQYSQDFEPILLYQSNAQGELEGLITLALHRQQGSLVVAGAHQAEYQCWLSTPGMLDNFIAETIKDIHQHFPNRQLVMRYLNPGFPQNTVLNRPPLKAIAEFEAYRRPILRCNENAFQDFCRKKSNKSRFNRLKREGDVRLVIFESVDTFAKIFTDIIEQCDLRQGAINDSCPFLQDPIKERFHLTLLEHPNLLHVAAMMVDDKVVGAHIGLRSEDTLYLGILTHSPFHANHSPGKMLIAMLSEKLAESGISAFDLTPGGDAWKDRFADEYEDAYQLTLHVKPKFLKTKTTKNEVYKKIKGIAGIAGITPNKVKIQISWLKSIFSGAGISDIPHRLSQLFVEERELTVYRREFLETDEFKQDSDVKKNSLPTLLRHDSSQSKRSRQEFLSSTLCNLENGANAYTIEEGARVACWGFFSELQKKSKLPEFDQEIVFPENSTLFYDFCANDVAGPSEEALYRRLIGAILNEARELPKVKYAYFLLPAANCSCKTAIEKLGFQYQYSFFSKRSIHSHKYWTNRPDSSLEAESWNTRENY